MIAIPSLDPTHVDYIPALFIFTTEERMTVLEKRAKKHKTVVVSMKKKRFQHQKKAPVRITVEQLVEQEILNIFIQPTLLFVCLLDCIAACYNEPSPYLLSHPCSHLTSCTVSMGWIMQVNL